MTSKKLTSKERVLTAFAHQEPDRVPVDYLANPGIDMRLKRHYGLAPGDDEGLLAALGVDFRYVWTPYTGPQLHPEPPGRTVDCWGIHRRWVEHDTGGYWDYTDFPLKDATLDTIANWPMPSPDDFDYQQVREACRRWPGLCVVAGNAGVGDIINSTGMIRTMEQVLVDLLTDDPAGICYIDRKQAVLLAVTERILEAGRGLIDMLYLGEDLGTQIGPLISTRLFRKQIRPRLQRFVDLGKAYHLPVMFHSCGSSSWAFDDFIEMGIQVIDTLQPEAANMAPAYLKQRFGDRLAFHGCISTGGPVAYGTPEEVVQNVRDTLEVMQPGGGYALCPSHQLQDNSPTENVIAMYAAAHTWGRYQ
jgi:uroporphyrinogen decarboxylase